MYAGRRAQAVWIELDPFLQPSLPTRWQASRAHLKMRSGPLTLLRPNNKVQSGLVDKCAAAQVRDLSLKIELNCVDHHLVERRSGPWGHYGYRDRHDRQDNHNL
jgi:hypothetical protein